MLTSTCRWYASTLRNIRSVSPSEPLLCAKYLPWTFPPLPKYTVCAAIFSKWLMKCYYLKMAGYQEYDTFASICLIIQEAHAIASVSITSILASLTKYSDLRLPVLHIQAWLPTYLVLLIRDLPHLSQPLPCLRQTVLKLQDLHLLLHLSHLELMPT